MESRGAAVALVSRHVADRKRREIVVLNCPDTLTIANRRAGSVRDVDEECFVGLDCVIAVNDDGERVSSLSRGNDLIRQTLRYIIAVRSGCGVVLRRNVKRHIRALRGRGKSYREGRGDGSTIAFNYRNVIDRQVGSRAARTTIQRRTRITRERRRSEEISRVVVCVHAAAGFSKVRSSVAGRRRASRAFETTGAGSIAGEIDDAGTHRTCAAEQRGVVDEGNLAGGRSHGDGSSGIGRGQAGRGATARRFLNQVIGARRQRDVR